MIIPYLRQDLEIFRGNSREDGAPAWLLYDAVRNKYFTLGLTAFKLIKNWRGGEDIQNFEKKINSDGIETNSDEIKSFIGFLQQNNLIVQPPGQNVNYLLQQKNSMKKNWLLNLVHSYLFFKIPLFKPDEWLGRNLNKVKSLGSAKFRNIIYILGFIGICLVIQQFAVFKKTFLYFFTFNGLMLYFATLVIVKCLHELGHAFVAKNYGCRVSAIGIAFLVFFPFLYTDTTDAWRLRNHKERLLINFAGILTELHLALIATFIWGILPEGGMKSVMFFIATTSWISSLLINVSPFMRFDGYYVLADFLRVENLQPRAFSLAKWKLRQIIFGLNHEQPEKMNANKINFLIFYAWSTWIYRFFLFIGIAILVYHYTFKVLGIILFVVEIIWFICLPIYREMALWWKMRSDIGLSFNFIRTILFISVLFFLFFYPWKNYQKIPAILQSENFISIYAPEEAQIKRVHIKEGDKVQKDQLLIELTSPSLNYKINQTIGKLELAELQINNALQSKTNREQLLSLRSKKNKLETEILNYNKIKSSLNIRAPFNAEITFLEKFNKDQWVNEEDPLLSLVNKDKQTIYAFISEKSIAKIDRTKDLFFISSHIDSPKIPLSIKSISKSPVNNFNLFPIVTSLYSGPIAARENSSSDIISEQAYYLVIMNLVEDITKVDQKMLGSVNIAIYPTSFAERIYKYVYAVLIRELSF